MVAVPGVQASIDEEARTARVEVFVPSRERRLAFRVDPAPDGRGWEIREPLGGVFAWRESFDGALSVAVAAAHGALEWGQRARR